MANSKYSRQCRVDQVGPANLTGAPFRPAPKLPQNPQNGYPGANTQNSKNKTPDAAGK